MPRTTSPRPADPSSVHYQVQVDDLHAHVFRVTLTIRHPQAEQRVAMPVWIPGSYLVREFSRNLQGLQATQGKRLILPTQLDKCRWQIRCDPSKPLELSYLIYAFDASVRTAWLDVTRGFFNGTSLCLRVEGQEDGEHALTLSPGAAPANWSVATGLRAVKVDRRGFGRYRAESYEALVDHPFELGNFWSGSFQAAGVPHRFVVSGAQPGFDGERLLADAQRICETAIRFWHAGGRAKGRAGKPPFDSYTFLLNATDSGYGGLEHRNSTALICSRRDLPCRGAKPAEGYTTLLGLISHEYFHTWNVKRLRPAEFTRYDFDQENYTQLLWFFEGFTSYYDDLLVRRAGLIDDAGYLRLLNKNVNQLQQTPGRAVQTVAQASFDAWVKYYRPDENTPNITVSYYGKGALVALCLDLTLRAEGQGTLDDVMRALWQRCRGGPMSEDDLLQVLHEVGGRSYARELRQWVHSTAELPLRPLLERQGVMIHEDPAQLAQRLGLRVGDGPGIQIKTVLRGGAADLAGLAAGDEWLAVEVGSGNKPSTWRVHKLDDLPLYTAGQARIKAWVARDKRMMHMTLKLPSQVHTWRLAFANSRLPTVWPAA